MFVVLSGRQGVPKTRILEALLLDKGTARVVTDTTRYPKRKSCGQFEINGKDYYFVPESSFMDPQLLSRYVELTVRNIDGRPVYFGTNRYSISEAEKQGSILLLGLDPSGLRRFKEIYHEEVITIVLDATRGDVERDISSRPDIKESSIKATLSCGDQDQRDFESYQKFIDHRVNYLSGKIEEAVQEIRDIIWSNPRISKTAQQ